MAGPSIRPCWNPPPSEIRQQLKRLSLQSNWAELLDAAETAMGKAYGRGWLDIQRYVCRACAELGRSYAPISDAVKSELRTLLQDLPELPQMTLMDDTATATADTLAWLRDLGAPQAGTASRADDPGTQSGAGASPDPFELATQAVSEGRPQEGLEILNRELARERSGRGRFHRKVQMAELCLSIGRDAIAFRCSTILRRKSSSANWRNGNRPMRWPTRCPAVPLPEQDGGGRRRKAASLRPNLPARSGSGDVVRGVR